MQLYFTECRKTVSSNATVVGILPITIDTITNRKAMPDSDYSTWTSIPHIAQEILEWSRKYLVAYIHFLI